MVRDRQAEHDDLLDQLDNALTYELDELMARACNADGHSTDSAGPWRELATALRACVDIAERLAQTAHPIRDAYSADR